MKYAFAALLALLSTQAVVPSVRVVAAIEIVCVIHLEDRTEKQTPRDARRIPADVQVLQSGPLLFAGLITRRERSEYLLRLFGLGGAKGQMNIPLFVCLAEWAFFILYWSAAAKNSSRAKVSESRQSRRIHELLLNAAFLLAILSVPGLRQRFLPNMSFVAWAGLVLQTGSFVLGVWARRVLGRHWSGEITIKVDHRLIRTGLYRFVRHPIYTAWLGMFAGTAIVSGQMHAALGFAMAAFAYQRKIRLEEANLKNAFGPGYDVYRRETWTLVPWLL